MHSLRASLVLATLIGWTGFALADEAELLLPRHAALTPDGETVVFSYGGDLFTASSEGGGATRLTADPATDDYPVVNRAGTQVAFASNRDDAPSFNVYVMPLAGGLPRRLTWDSGLDRPLCFGESDGQVLFQSYRGNGDLERYGVYTQSASSPSEPKLLIDAALGSVQPALTRRREYLAHRGGVAWWREGYRGSAASEIYRVNTMAGSFKRVTQNDHRDRWPLRAGDDEVIWVSGEGAAVGEASNLFYRKGDGPPVRLTAFQRDGARHPTTSEDGKVILFERGLALYRIDRTYDDRNGDGFSAPRKLRFHAVADLPREVTWRQRVRVAEEVVPSRDGKGIAFVAEGELYVRRVMDGTPVRVTNSPSRESSPIFSRDNKSLYFVSDRAGERALYRVRAAKGEDPRLHRALRFETELLYAAPGQPVFRPQLSPDGRKLGFVRGGGDLCFLDLDAKGNVEGEPRVVFTGWDAPIYSFSPDSAWIAYARENADFNTDVFVLELATGHTVNVSQHPDDDTMPVWSPDGRKLAFVSKRHDDEYNVHLVYLREADHEMTDRDRADRKEDRMQKKPAPKKPTPKEPAKPDPKAPAAKPAANEVPAPAKVKAKPRPGQVVVDELEMWRRIRRVKVLHGSQSWVAFTAESNGLIFRSDHEGKPELYRMTLKGEGVKALTKGQDPKNMEVCRPAKGIFYLRAGKFPARVGEAGGAISSYLFDVPIAHPLREVQAQVFHEAWRTMHELFYDDTFKGKSWPAIRDKYEEAAVSRLTRREFQDVVRMMLGELNASHLGIMEGPRPRSTAPATGRLGVTLTPADNGWHVADVLPDGPCDREQARLRVGDFVVAIDAVPLTPDTILAHRLEGTVSQRVVLTVRRESGGGSEAVEIEKLRVVVRPASDAMIRALNYERWTSEARALVERRSQGQLGYVHVRSMTAPSLERFEAELFARANGKQGLVIDVRNNGGGWTADYLLTILTAPQHAFTVPRGGSRGYPQGRRPLAGYTKPIIVLINQNSFSNAEIFAHAVKTLGRGQLVGVATHGGVISTGASTLLDGYRLRTPFRGWYLRGSGADMELNGAKPDIAVENPLGDPHDYQAEAAVDALLRSLSF